MFEALSSYPMVVDRVFVPRGCDADLCLAIKTKHGRLRYDQRRRFFLRTESGLAGCWAGPGRLGDVTASLILEGQGRKYSGENTPARADSSQYFEAGVIVPRNTLPNCSCMKGRCYIVLLKINRSHWV
jgi:hypothetical protein